MGGQDTFDQAQGFLDDTGVRNAQELTMLWEGSGNIWNLNNVRTNSAMQLFSYDLSQQSGLIFFNKAGKRTVLDAAIQTPWAPDDSPHLFNP